jgi:RNA recognition motif-containing protein
MEKTLVVENLPPDMDEERLRSEFSKHGTVVSAEIICDPETGESRGLGTVEMETPDQAEEAMTALHERELEGFKLQVTEGRPPARQQVPQPDPFEVF